MSSFVGDSSFYRESFKAIKKEQLQQDRACLRDNVIPAFLKTLAKTKVNLKEVINILSVGSGEGEPDLYLIQELLHKFVIRNDGKISYTVIEINQDFIVSFQEKVKQNSETLEKVEFRWIWDTFEKVLDGGDLASEFDIIVFYHVLYYMDAESVLEKCVDDLLKPGGCVFCVVQGKEDFLTSLVHRYHPRFQELWKEMYFFSVQDLENWAKKHRWGFESFHVSGTLNIQPVFDPQSREGRLILDFFFQTQDVVKVLGNEVLEEILEILRGFRLRDSTFSDAEFRVAKNRGMILIYGR